MKERLFKSLAAIFLLLCMVFNLFGCINPAPICNHIWIITEKTEPTCTTTGSITTECSLCGEISTLMLATTEHTLTLDYCFDGANHWNECSVCKSRSNVSDHIYTTFTNVNDSYHLKECSTCDCYCNESHEWDETNHCILCGAVNSGDTPTKKEKIQIFVPQQNGIIEFTRTQIEKFLADNPDCGYSISDFLIVCGPDEATTNIIIDVATAPDIYCFTQDYLNRLVQADALAPLGQTAANAITANNDAVSVGAVTVGDKIYAYPMTIDNGYYLYYDKTVVTDPTDLQRIVDDCVNAGAKFHFELENGWYAASFFFGVGCHSIWKTDDDGNFIGIDDNFDDNALGVAAMKGIQIVTQSDCYVNSDAIDGDYLGAVVSGTWNAENAAKYFGENLGVCKLPSFTVDGETYQLGSFSRYKFMGVKPQVDSEREEVCSALAQYLTGMECQMERFNEFQWCPSNNNDQVNETVKKNPSLLALKAQSPYAVAQGYIPNEWWTSAAGLAKKAATCATDGEIKTALAAYRAEIESILD